MRIHMIGVATTFMTGLALLARQSGHDVTGSDSCIDPSTRQTLETVGVQLQEGFYMENLAYKPDLVVLGNELHPNNQELVEARRLAIPCILGSEWLEKYILNDKWTKNSKPAEDKKEKQKPHFPHISDKADVRHAPKIPLEPNTKPKRITR